MKGSVPNGTGLSRISLNSKDRKPVEVRWLKGDQTTLPDRLSEDDLRQFTAPPSSIRLNRMNEAWPSLRTKPSDETHRAEPDAKKRGLDPMIPRPRDRPDPDTP